MPVDINIETKTEVLLEALPYLQQFKGCIFVVKFGGAFMDTEQARVGVATDLVFLATVGIHVIVVHGGGPAINKAMARANIEPVWKNGLRITDSETIGIVENTLNKEINLGICENIQIRKGNPIGIMGQDVFRCKKLETDRDGNPIDLGFVGDIQHVETTRLKKYLKQHYMPIVSPVGKDADGQHYNINADVAAAHLASAIGARRLVYLCDVPGLLRDPKDPDSLISSISEFEVPGLREEGVIGSGMLPKVESAVSAMSRGVHRIHLIDGRMPHSILLEIFTDKGVGTEIVPNPS
jgi:acetylglutamate kinase